MNLRLSDQRGMSTGVVITIVSLSLVSAVAIGLAVWAFINYTNQKNNVDAIVTREVAEAEKIQADELEEKFFQREKEPNRSFAGPSDFGTLGFKYPKTWSIYVAEAGEDGDDYEAYFNPVTVPPIANDERYALRVTITDTPYEDVIEDYQSLVEDGDLRTSATKANGQSGTRLDGKFSDDIRGAAVIYKIRDKTAVIQTDADTFKADFDALIKTITFNS